MQKSLHYKACNSTTGGPIFRLEKMSFLFSHVFFNFPIIFASVKLIQFRIMFALEHVKTIEK